MPYIHRTIVFLDGAFLARVVMAYIAVANAVMAYVVMACVVMAYIVMACIVMAGPYSLVARSRQAQLWPIYLWSIQLWPT